METGHHGVVDTAFAEICETYGFAVGMCGKIFFKMSQREIVYSPHGLTFAFLLALFVAYLMLFNLNMIFIGQIAKRFIEAHLFKLHDEIYRRAAFSATETLADATCRRYTERRRTLVVERA